jgi:hypothetical protein
MAPAGLTAAEAKGFEVKGTERAAWIGRKEVAWVVMETAAETRKGKAEAAETRKGKAEAAETRKGKAAEAVAGQIVKAAFEVAGFHLILNP